MKRSCMILAIVLFATTAFADTVNEPVTNTNFEKTFGSEPVLKLFGVAPRIKNVLGVYGAKVYGAGLYVDEEALLVATGGDKKNKIRIAAALMSMSGERAIVLKFVRDLEKKVMADAFKEGIEKSISINDPKIAADAKKFLAAFTAIKNGDWATMKFSGKSVTLYGNDDKLVSVENRSLSRALMQTFVGTNPVDEKVKKGLLKGLE